MKGFKREQGVSKGIIRFHHWSKRFERTWKCSKRIKGFQTGLQGSRNGSGIEENVRLLQKGFRNSGKGYVILGKVEGLQVVQKGFKGLKRDYKVAKRVYEEIKELGNHTKG